MKLKWYGHAAFMVTAEDGTRIITDPYNAEVGYRVPLEEAAWVTISHEHFDHNSIGNVPGTPEAIRGAGSHAAGGVKVTGVATEHDDVGGSKRGHNTVFCLDVPDGGEVLRLCHLGDLGHQLTAEQVAALGEVDVLMIPVGGTYTLDPAGAAEQVRAIKPRLVVPMHYKTAALSFPLKPVDDFIAEMIGSSVERTGTPSVERGAADIKALPRSERPPLLVLEYVR